MADDDPTGRDLRRLTEPLLADPVIAPTPLAQIRRRAARRNRQRAGALALGVVVLLAVGGTALARAGREGPSVQVGTTTPDAAGQADLRIFLAPDVTTAQVALVRDALLADPEVTSLVFNDHAESYAQFRCFFHSQPDLMESVLPSEIPPSFDVDVVGGQVEVDRLIERFDGAAGVKEVVPNPRWSDPRSSTNTLPPGLTLPPTSSGGRGPIETVLPYPGHCPMTGVTER